MKKTFLILAVLSLFAPFALAEEATSNEVGRLREEIQEIREELGSYRAEQAEKFEEKSEYFYKDASSYVEKAQSYTETRIDGFLGIITVVLSILAFAGAIATVIGVLIAWSIGGSYREATKDLKETKKEFDKIVKETKEEFDEIAKEIKNDFSGLIKEAKNTIIELSKKAKNLKEIKKTLKEQDDKIESQENN